LKLTELVRQTNRMRELVEETKNSLVYHSFLQEIPQFSAEFTSLVDTFLTDPAEFTSYFTKSLKYFSNVLKESRIYGSLMLHHHCWMMNKLSFEQFLLFHPEFNDLDQLIQNASDETIQWFCVQPAPGKTRKLFDSAAFDEAFDLLNRARQVFLPMIALPKISAAIELLNNLFTLYYGQSAQADELTPLIHFLFLKWKAVRIFSFMQYLGAFTKPLIDKSIITLPESVLVGQTHIVNHMDSLAFFLKKQTAGDGQADEAKPPD
jgi:hypothetical protein